MEENDGDMLAEKYILNLWKRLIKKKLYSGVPKIEGCIS